MPAGNLNDLFQSGSYTQQGKQRPVLSFLDALEVILPSLPSGLAGQDRQSHWKKATRSIPPLATAGFEIRLDNSAEPDLLIYLPHDDPALYATADHFDNRSDPFSSVVASAC